jgi:hypothetical protein
MNTVEDMNKIQSIVIGTMEVTFLYLMLEMGLLYILHLVDLTLNKKYRFIKKYEKDIEEYKKNKGTNTDTAEKEYFYIEEDSDSEEGEEDGPRDSDLNTYESIGEAIGEVYQIYKKDKMKTEEDEEDEDEEVEDDDDNDEDNEEEDDEDNEDEEEEDNEDEEEEVDNELISKLEYRTSISENCILKLCEITNNIELNVWEMKSQLQATMKLLEKIENRLCVLEKTNTLHIETINDATLYHDILNRKNTFSNEDPNEDTIENMKNETQENEEILNTSSDWNTIDKPEE